MYKHWLKISIYFAVYFLVAKLSIYIRTAVGYYPMVWLPSGVGLGMLVVEGEAYWPIIFAATIAFCLTEPLSFPSILVMAVTNTLECVVGARIMRKYSFEAKPKFGTIRETLLFIVLIMGVISLVSSLLACLGLVVVGQIPSDKYYFTVKVWWFSQAMGNLIMGTAIICFANDIRSRTKILWARRFEFFFLVSIVAFTCMFIYTPFSKFNHSLIIRHYFLFPLLIWVAIRFDTLGVIAMNFIVMTTMLIGALKGVLPAGFESVEERLLVHQLVAMALGLTGFVLAAAIKEKEEALDARGEFINIASHELKTPITSLKLQYDIISRKLAHPVKISEKEINSIFKKMGHQISKLISTVEQLLNTARFDHGTFQLNISKVKLSKIMKDVLDSMSADFLAARSEAKLIIKNDLAGYWDSFRVEQVLNNILSNALKYAPGKPVEISVSGENNCARIRIQDHGPGIDPEKQGLIFNRFVRAADLRKTEGLGLGLFIARRIVEAHGGHIGVRSVLGAGAIFEIDLPIIRGGFPIPS